MPLLVLISSVWVEAETLLFLGLGRNWLQRAQASLARIHREEGNDSSSQGSSSQAGKCAVLVRSRSWAVLTSDYDSISAGGPTQTRSIIRGSSGISPTCSGLLCEGREVCRCSRQYDRRYSGSGKFRACVHSSFSGLKAYTS